MSIISFIDNKGNFSINKPDEYNNLYFPVASEKGIKSVVSPNMNGDSKLDQNTFLLEPVSIENLNNNKSGRNFWVRMSNGEYWSAVGNSAEAEALRYDSKKDVCSIEAGFMWHTISRESLNHGLKSKITSFVPYNSNVEIMLVSIMNTQDEVKTVTPVAAVPVYGRSADNLRDHRHVTSLLHRVTATENGVYVKPRLSFDERGHKKNNITYFVCGSKGNGEKPCEFYPVAEQFIGDNGSFINPEAVAKNKAGVKAGTIVDGVEALGGFKFADVELKKDEWVDFIVVMGATDNEAEIDEAVKAYATSEAVNKALKETEDYWQEKVNLWFKTKDSDFDNYMRWVAFQPFLRRVYGCSFLPHHDYGKGGRGWRDLWQDCLALLIMDPKDVRGMLLDNFGGVRIDGTNATIIGSKQGEFIADRNNIPRVWMDHGMWPFLTTKLYIEQTGDLDVLSEEQAYFKDGLAMRGTSKDELWNDAYGNLQKDANENVYKGTVLEHLILQHIAAINETGEHGIILLRGADWNDAIDMAADRGESVAFSCAYAGNLKDIAAYVRMLAKNGKTTVSVFEELAELIKTDDFDAFKKNCAHSISGKKVDIDAEELAVFLEKKSEVMMNRIRENEWIDDNESGWFNSYYDNNGRRVEGRFDDQVRMMLTGQVFAIMSKTASDEQVRKVCDSADKYLYKAEIGGYRLNTDFQEEKYDMGRMFGFAYGEKENGAVFSHMTVMYANALYSRGYAKEGYKAIKSLSDAALNFETSQIYPGIPEYFNGKGKGLYHYLTGAASWYALTMVTEVFGVRGELGNLKIEPKLMAEQFDAEGKVSIELVFAGKKLVVEFVNKDNLEYGQYKLGKCTCEGNVIWEGNDSAVVIDRAVIEGLGNDVNRIVVDMCK